MHNIRRRRRKVKITIDAANIVNVFASEFSEWVNP
jgi:hypothetical protein